MFVSLFSSSGTLSCCLSVILPCSHTQKRNIITDMNHKSLALLHSKQTVTTWDFMWRIFNLIKEPLNGIIILTDSPCFVRKIAPKYQPDCMLRHAFPTSAPLFNLTGHSRGRVSVIANLKLMQNGSPSPFALLNSHNMRPISFSEYKQRI